MKFLPMLLVLILLLPTIAFAQLNMDIGELIFRDILKMTEYPGAPFTGNIINDLVMMLFIPSVFIIVVIYTLVGRLTPHPKLNLLMSLAFYAFIVFGGYFRIFALLAGPYFLFLLIIMGLLFFFLGHFGLRRGGLGGHAAGGGMSGAAVGAGNNPYAGWDYNALRKELNKTNDEIRKFEHMRRAEEEKRDKLIKNAQPGAHIDMESASITRLNEKLQELEQGKIHIEYAMGLLKGKW